MHYTGLNLIGRLVLSVGRVAGARSGAALNSPGQAA